MVLVAKTLYGLEDVLAEELKGLGASNVRPANRAVVFDGDKYMLYKVNYFSRTALSVLQQVAKFKIRSADDLYNSSLKINWEKYLDNNLAFSVVPVVNSPIFKHTGFAALRLKDTIADWFRQKTNSRPFVDTTDPDIVFNLHISNDLVTISIDSTVIPLYKRGYRKEQGQAPLNEALAAGIIMLAGWNGSTEFIDPMCGSGTLPIEAALIASNTPPGRFRNSFGFQKWKDYDNELYRKIKLEGEAGIIKPVASIYASDISEEATGQTIRNVEAAGLADIIKVKQADFKDTEPFPPGGTIFMNPPYGHRIKISESEDLYSMIGSSLKHKFPGFSAWIISSDRDLLKHIGLKPSFKKVLYNGSLECLLVKYALYAGTKKTGNTI